MKRKHSDMSGEDEDMSNEYIMAIVEQITASVGTLKQKQERFGREYPTFQKRMPMLFDMACEPNFDMNRLRYMLSLRTKVRENKTSIDAASKEVGQKLFNIYVKDKVQTQPPPPPPTGP